MYYVHILMPRTFTTNTNNILTINNATKIHTNMSYMTYVVQKNDTFSKKTLRKIRSTVYKIFKQ